MDNSKEIVDLPGLFVLIVGYVDIITYSLTKYYYISERAHFNYRYQYIYIIYQYIFIIAVFIFSIMEVYDTVKVPI